METKLKKCADCKEYFPLPFFRKLGSYETSCHGGKTRYSALCKKCEFKKRASAKVKTKAANAIYDHAKLLGVTPEQFSAGGVTKDYVTYLFQRELNLIKDGMEYCVNCFPDKDEKEEEDECYNRETKQGDVTLDIIDIERFRLKGILTRSNVRAICRTANTAKGRKDSTDYDVETKNYRDAKRAIRKGIQSNLLGAQPLQITESSNGLQF